MTSRLRIVVLGMMGRLPFGGQSWLYLNWLRGLATLGHDVWYVEDDVVWPYDPRMNTVTDDCTYAVRHLDRCLARIGFEDRWAFRLAKPGGACHGLTGGAVAELYRSCDALLNIGGATALRAEHFEARYRVYVETDPVTAELRLASGADPWNPFAEHHAVATYGENYGAPDCGVPLGSITFHKTRQPVDLDLWPMTYDSGAPYFTTIGNYRQDGSDVAWNGDVYRWSKHHEWEKFLDLPSRTSQPLQMALTVPDHADRTRLLDHGWRVVSPLTFSLDVFGQYPAYVRRSRGEFTVAKDQNVRLRSGWFSERAACYLASGKPVVMQDTAFSNVLPTGAGLFGVVSVEEAADAIGRINADYGNHCRSARLIAEEWFTAPRVARELLADLGLT